MGYPAGEHVFNRMERHSRLYTGELSRPEAVKVTVTRIACVMFAIAAARGGAYLLL